MNSHQDWNTVTFTKTPKKSKPTGKPSHTGNSSIILNDNDEIVKIKLVPREIGILINTARNVKKLTRKQLANQLNLKEDIITNIETGTAIYNGQLISTIKRKLNIT
jgi:ribosome-binding protein aMBF1 (putative translation factor)